MGEPGTGRRSGRGAAGRTAITALTAVLLLAVAGCPTALSGFGEPAHTDGDGDGFCEVGPCEDGSIPGDCDDTLDTVHPGADEACDGLDSDCDGQLADDELDGDGDGYLGCGGDCDPLLDWIHPGAEEICDGKDDDCDGELRADEVDEDGDGWRECNGDCDDGDAAVHPEATEVCDGVDNDCDPSTDEDVDDDGDGISECEDDCDDDEAATYPGAEELCDGEDNDCNGTLPPAERDQDGDGWMVCEGDCADTDPWFSPGAAEICDGVDNDCDQMVDEDCVDCAVWVPTDVASLTDAAFSANAHDVVCLEPGVHYENTVISARPVEVLGVAGSGATVLDGGMVDRTLWIDGQATAGTVVRGVTISRGWTTGRGGGVLLTSTQVFMEDVVVFDNVAFENGAGIYVYDSSDLVLHRGRIEANGSPSGSSGGMSVTRYSSAELVDVEFIENRATGIAGGLELSGADVIVDRCTFTRNRTQSSGAGIYTSGYFDTPSSLEVTDCLFEGNYSDGGAAAGLYLNAGSATVRDTTFLDNTADSAWAIACDGELVLENVRVVGNQSIEWDQGSASISVQDDCDLQATNLLVAGNRGGGRVGMSVSGGGRATIAHGWFLGNSSEYGKVIHAVEGLNGGAKVTLDHVVVVGNETLIPDAGHCALFAGDTASLTVTNSIVAGNHGGFQCYGDCVLTLRHNDVWDNDGMDYYLVPFDPTGTDGNLSVDPRLQDLSSPDPLLWDVHLASDSPLVDAGTGAADPDGTPADIGAYGGAAAGTFDRDLDGYPEWWHPGPYDPATDPGGGWDCDDGDPDVYPGNGC